MQLGQDKYQVIEDELKSQRKIEVRTHKTKKNIN